MLLPNDWRVITRALISWNFAIFLYFITVAAMVSHSDQSSMSRRAAQQDDGRFAILVFTVVAAAAAFGAIFYQLLLVKDVHGCSVRFISDSRPRP